MAYQLKRDIGEVKYTAAGTLTMGTPFLASTQVLIPMTNASAGELVTARCHGVFTVVKLAGTTAFAWTVGQKLYWVAATSNFSTVGTSNTYAGRAAETATKAAVTGVIQLGVV